MESSRKSSHISVYIRFRPLSIPEKQSSDIEIWKIHESSVSLLQDLPPQFLEQRKSQQIKTFLFSNPYTANTFSSISHNTEVFDSVCSPFISLSLQGYNFTLFAFGQTGSGKTYTMLGSENIEYLKHKRRRSASPCRNLINKVQISNKGMSLMFIESLMCRIQKEKVYKVVLSYFEIYNENVFDLLGNDESLGVGEDPLKGFYVKGLTERLIGSFEEALELICAAESNRKFSPTEQNQHSSRSHVILKLGIASVSEGSWDYESSVHFVDLAGSERLGNKKVQNAESITEGKHINTSLFYLCSVIHKLAEKSAHVPYRNSNLTKILRNAIGGNSFTSIICTASPGLSCFDMTLSTMAFAEAAKKVKNKVSQNFAGNSPNDLIKTMQNEIFALRALVQTGSVKEFVDKTVETEGFNETVEVEMQKLFEELRKSQEKALKSENELEKKIEEKKRFLVKMRISEERIAGLEELVKELKRENDVLLGKYLPKMKYEAICNLEKFYFCGIDRAKEFRVKNFTGREEKMKAQCKTKSFKVLSPILCDKENIINFL